MQLWSYIDEWEICTDWEQIYHTFSSMFQGNRVKPDTSPLSTVSNLEKQNYRRTPCAGLKEHNLIPKEPASITLKDINLLINKRLLRWLLNVQMLRCDDQCLQAYKAEPARETIFTAACCLHREQIVQFHRVPSTNLRYLYLCWA